MKKALFLCSSPRKVSNTSMLAGIVAEKFRNKGIETEIIDISSLKYKTNGCIDCGACQESTEYDCIIRDDATEILQKIHTFDYLIFATPVYFMGANAQLKLFLDRMQSLYKFTDTGNTTCIGHLKLALISTSGGGLDLGLNLLDSTFKRLSDYSSIEFSSLLIPRIKEFKDISTNEEILEKVREFVTHF